LSKVQVDTIDTRSGTSTMQIGSTNTSTINIGVSGDTVNIPSGVTIANAGTATGFGGDNTPSFRARLATNQSISDATNTKLAFATEDWDTDSAFASNKWTPGEAGKYVINAQLGASPIGDGNRIQLWFYINNSSVDYGKSRVVMAANSNDAWMSTTLVTELGATDYIEAYVYQSSGGSVSVYATGAYFSGFKLIGV
jgi:hypothetical protein